MNLFDTIFELIDMRSFSNLWYWIGLAVIWSSASHWVLGVPFDMIQRAKRKGGEPMQDLEDLARINVNRILYIARVSGLWLSGFVCFLLTSLVLLGFVYRVEFAQAVFFVAFPMTIVGVVSISTASLIEQTRPLGEDLCARLMRHRLYVQLVGMATICVTAPWGIWQLISQNILH